MLELLTGGGLALAAGLNAYVPLILVGLASRFTGVLELPAAWSWLENGWVLGILGVLLVLELVADKIPIVDHVNDLVQTVVRPAAGGLAFGSGATSETVAVTDPAEFFGSQQWVPIAIGAALALLVHLAKAAARPVINAAAVGLATPLVSAIEDVGSVALSLLAVIVPILVIIAVPLLALLAWRLVRRMRRKRDPSPA